MNKLIAVTLAAAVLLSGCGQPMVLPVNGDTKVYPTYGFFNKDSSKSQNVCYEISVGNVVWSVLLFSTVVAPVYFIGFSLYNPVSVKGEKDCGID